MTSTPAGLDSRRAWFMWGLGTLAYVSAVTQRTSFGVAGVEAGERFQAGASVVSLFVVVQLLTYAALQVPVGILADRFGTRRVLAVGAALMALGQLGLALSGHLGSALVARVLVGAGDAMTFGPLLRLLPGWFSARRLPVLNQVTAIVGQAGQLLSALPFATLLALEGWTPAFASAAALSVLVCVLTLALLRNGPPGTPASGPADQGSVARQVAGIVREPAAHVAFWIHWMCASPAMLFALMWGYPFLTRGVGLSQQAASGLFTLFALAGLPFAPLIGLLSHRAPLQRSNLAFVVAAGAAVPWAAVLLWPGPPPVWLLAVLVVGLAASGPGSGIGFDVARSAVPRHSVGTASGFVIVAGFTAGLVNIWVVGLVLDLLGGYTLDNFRWALATQFLFLGVGVVGTLRARATVRRRLVGHGVRILPAHRIVAREWRSWQRQWRAFRARSGAEAPRPEPGVALPTADGLVVHVVALVPGVAGDLVAIDVPPADADDAWWEARVGDYLAIVGHPDTRVASVEVRCADADEAEEARRAIAEHLTARDAGLAVEVTVRR